MPSPTYTDTSVTDGTTYYYKVSAVNPCGESARSAEASGTPTSGFAFLQSSDISSVIVPDLNNLQIVRYQLNPAGNLVLVCQYQSTNISPNHGTYFQSVDPVHLGLVNEAILNDGFPQGTAYDGTNLFLYKYLESASQAKVVKVNPVTFSPTVFTPTFLFSGSPGLGDICFHPPTGDLFISLNGSGGVTIPSLTTAGTTVPSQYIFSSQYDYLAAGPANTLYAGHTNAGVVEVESISLQSPVTSITPAQVAQIRYDAAFSGDLYYLDENLVLWQLNHTTLATIASLDLSSYLSDIGGTIVANINNFAIGPNGDIFVAGISIDTVHFRIVKVSSMAVAGTVDVAGTWIQGGDIVIDIPNSIGYASAYDNSGSGVPCIIQFSTGS